MAEEQKMIQQRTGRYAKKWSILEDQNLVAKRSSRADEHMAEGKSYKHAWYLAFKEFPRTYSDEDILALGKLRTIEVDSETSTTGTDSN